MYRVFVHEYSKGISVARVVLVGLCAAVRRGGWYFDVDGTQEMALRANFTGYGPLRQHDTYSKNDSIQCCSSSPVNR